MSAILRELANLEAERAVLGSILIDNGALVELIDRLSPADFFLKSNGLIYQAMIDLFQDQTPIDLLTVEAELGGREVGDGRARGMTYLTQLMLDTASSCHVHEYARIVIDLAERRRLILAGQSVAQLAADLDLELALVRERAHREILECVHGKDEGVQSVASIARPWLDDMIDRMAEPGSRKGIDTGYYDLDRLTNGLRPHQLAIFAGRPGMGKTALLLGMAHNLAVLQGRPGVVFSLEMGVNELLTRLVARRISVETQRLDRGELDDDESLKFYRAVGELSEAPLWIDDSPGLSVLEMRARSMRIKSLNDGRLDWIMVDFLQLARMPGAAAGYDEVSQVARELKNMAKALNAPVIAASQLNREPEKRNDHRPQLADLRDSGQIEEAADLIGFLYRDDYYNALGPATNKGELNLAKQRAGPTGRLELYWNASTASYFNLRKEEKVKGQ